MTQQYKKINNITGWIVFAIASLVFLLTIEPTVSFWDCGEFISTSFKLEVGHPPGAPLFNMLTRIVTLLSFGNHAHAAKMINSYSAIMSGLTILFLFWTITHIARRVVSKGKKELSLEQTIVIMGTGIIGALAYAFTDSFWFSAVEAEVYASSSFFTAIVFWTILKWEDEADEPGANRWIILAAYLMGLSIGVHLLNILTIPALVFVYYFKKHTPSRNGFLAALAIAMVITAVVLWGIIPYLFKIAFQFELIFTNGFGLPFNTGAVFYFVALIALIVWGTIYTHKKGKALANTIILAFAVIIIGYSSYFMVMIRSNANPPLDENNPESVFNLVSFLNRDQYGDTPLLFGQYYNAPLDPQKPYVKDKKWYIQKGGKYVVADEMQKPNYDERFTGFLPRMWSPEPRHVAAYKYWGRIEGTPIMVTKNDGTTETLYKPTFGENMTYLFRYQLGHMFWRYFMWNFAGRQNDIQGNGELTNGNWICGIPFIDNMRLGDQSKLPKTLRENKGHNTYFLLPFILGIFGIFYLLKRDKEYSWIIFVFFMITGVAIIIFLNQYPFQPRERDYAYGGAFYAFSIWIGIGVLSVYEFMKKYINGTTSAVLATVVCTSVPTILIAQNWDDHDRSSRYFARDFASDYLNSCAPNAILFTNGDNDTFPLWYCQEVEGIRTDVRVVNLSLLNTDWYIDQMKRRAYNSAPVPFSLTQDKYVQGKRDVVYVMPDPRLKNDYQDIKDVMDYISSDAPETKYNNEGEFLDILPATKLKAKVDSINAIRSGAVPKGQESRMVKEIKWEVKGSNVVKNHLMVLDLLAQNDWKRPIYFAITVGSENYFGLEKYFRQEGLAYRLVPYETKTYDGQEGEIGTDKMYKNMMETFKWGGLDDPKAYADEGVLRMAMNFRNLFTRLALALEKEGKKDSALKVLDRGLKVMPNNLVPYNYFNLEMATMYNRMGQPQKAESILKTIIKQSKDNLRYYLSIDENKLYEDQDNLQRELGVANEIVRVATSINRKDLAKDIINSTIVQIEENYKFVQMYGQFANDQKKLGEWYQSLNDLDKNILALYMQFEQSKQQSKK
jgi:tetratricopeptide (TPR) repeat protein